MNYNLIPTDEFKKNVKNLYKKYINIKNDIEELAKELSKNPYLGTELSNNTYKIRIKNTDNNKGKSAGYRVITYIVDKDKTIFLISIYSKSKQDNIIDTELQNLIKTLITS